MARWTTLMSSRTLPASVGGQDTQALAETT